MKKRFAEWVDRLIEVLFVGIAISILIFLFSGSFLLPNERQSEIFQCEKFETEWLRIHEDGTTKPISVPGRCDVAKGETLTIATVLPETYKTGERTWLCFRSSLQDMQFFVDGELRESYSTKGTRLWGKSSVSAYVFVMVNSGDSGKELTVNITTDSQYAGVVSEVYCGTVFGMYMQYAGENIVEVIVALLMLILAATSVIFGLFIQIKMKKKLYLTYLGWGELMLALWVLSESPMRQLYYQNISLAGYITHFMVFLFAVPFLLFMNSVQKRRHNNIYRVMMLTELGFFAVASLLEIVGAGEFPVLFRIGTCIHLLSVACIVYTFCCDIRKGYAKSYRLIIYGFFGFAAGALLQLYLYSIHTIILNGGVLCIGAIFWLLMTVISSVKDYFELEKENIRNRRRAERLTYQVMEALVQTIEAKDTYTKGHSARVAEYAKALAKDMGLTSEAQNEVYYMGMLHDIGKIGISDTIINKPGRLTDEEYAVIKSHPVIGYDILKKMDEIKGIERVARWHHERYDGKGYPDGLRGEEIPLYARIIAVADVYDAMTSNRSYRQTLPQAEVRKEIERVKGSQLDPVIAEHMLHLIDADTGYHMRQEQGKAE